MRLEEDYQDENEEGGVVFDIRVLFGATDIEFY